MTCQLAKQMTRLLPRAGEHLLVAEVPAAQGIADVVAVRFDQEAIRQRLEGGVGPIGSPLRVRTLDLLRDDRFTQIGTIARKIGSNPYALMRSTLGPLAELGIVEVAGATVRATGLWRPLGGHLTAVELKLSKWRDALRQADNLALSADRTWVVLDQARAKGAVDASDYFRQFGVGLAVLDVEGGLRVIVSPQRRRPERWLRSLFAERAWALTAPALDCV